MVMLHSPAYQHVNKLHNQVMLKAIAFDMDGTLGDTLSLCIESFRRCTCEYTGRYPSVQEVVSHFNVSDRGVLGALLSLPPDSPPAPGSAHGADL